MPRKQTYSFETSEKIFPHRLRDVMQRRGMTQQMLADAIHCQRQTISNYASGQSAPDADIIPKIAKVLGVSADWLLGLAEEETPSQELRAACEITGLSLETVKLLSLLNIAARQSGEPDEIITAISTVIDDGSLIRALYLVNDARVLLRQCQNPPLMECKDDVLNAIKTLRTSSPYVVLRGDAAAKSLIQDALSILEKSFKKICGLETEG